VLRHGYYLMLPQPLLPPFFHDRRTERIFSQCAFKGLLLALRLSFTFLPIQPPSLRTCYKANHHSGAEKQPTLHPTILQNVRLPLELLPHPLSTLQNVQNPRTSPPNRTPGPNLPYHNPPHRATNRRSPQRKQNRGPGPSIWLLMKGSWV